MGRGSGVRVAVVLLLAYVGGYFALLQPADLTVLDGASGYRGRVPTYRAGGPVAAAVFRPLARLDQRVRPGYWAWESLPYGADCMSVPAQVPEE